MSPATWDRHHKDPDHHGHRGHRPKAKKDTRHWCKGKVGVPHQPEVNRQSYAGSWPCREPSAWFKVQYHRRSYRPWWCYHQIACRVCGKILAHQLDWRECPDLPASMLKEMAK